MQEGKENIEEIEKKEFLVALGEQIKKVREAKGISSAEFGRRAFIERSHISRLEGGGTNPTATTLKTICEALEISLEELFKDFKG